MDEECDDVNVVVTQYDDFLSKLLDKHAPLKEIDVVERQLNDWMTDDILALKKKIRRKKELICRKNPITINFDIYIESCKAVKLAIENGKAELIKKKITDCNGDQKKLFKVIDSLLGSVANLAALGCVGFCFLTFLTRKIWLFERTHKNA